MQKPGFKCTLFFSFLAAVMSVEASHAAGLGRLTVNSVQGQPFKAEIDLVTVTTEEKSSLDARLASHDVFRKVNVDYSPLLSTFKTTIEIHPDGQPYIQITSPQPVDEPFLNILIELNWASGLLLREYTALLPLAETGAPFRQNESAQPASQCYPRIDSADGKADPAIARDSVSSGQDRLLPGAAMPNPSYRTYPVRSGDTLSGIAKNIALPPEASFNQMLVALFRANREAFSDNNMHQLKAGLVLRIPDNSEINAIPVVEADQEVRAHTAEWHKKRSSKTEEREKEWGPLPWALVL